MESDAERQLHGIVKVPEQRSTISPDGKKGREKMNMKKIMFI